MSWFLKKKKKKEEEEGKSKKPWFLKKKAKPYEQDEGVKSGKESLADKINFGGKKKKSKY